MEAKAERTRIMNEEKFIVKELPRESFVHRNANRAVRCWTVHHTDEGGWTEGEFTFHTFDDGSITISGDGNDAFVSMGADAVNVLRGLLTQKGK